MRVFALIFLFILGCGGSEEVVDKPPIEKKSVIEQAQLPEPEPDRDEFVILHRNKPVYLAPNDDAPFVQYRTEEDQKAFNEKRREAAEKRAEKQQERYEKEIEREKKRLKRIKDPDDREEYVRKRRDSRARRYIKSIHKQAKRSKEGHPNSRFIVYRILEDQGDWLAVETLSKNEQRDQCYSGGHPGLSQISAKLWVKRKDLSEVTVRREAYQVWRGSEVKLAPGVVVTKSGKRHVAFVDGFQVELKVPEDARSDRFSSRSFFEAPFTDTTFTDIALAEGQLKVSRNQSLPPNPYFDLYVTGTLWVGKKFFASTQTPCAEFTVHAEEAMLEPVGRRGAMRLGGAGDDVIPPWVDRGVTVYTAEGEELGKTTGEQSLGHELKPRGDRRCFEQNVFKAKKKKRRRKKRSKPPKGHTFEICIPANDVSDKPPGP